MSVQLWSEGQPLMKGVVLCHAEESAALQAAVAAHGGAITAYQVLPNGRAYVGQIQCMLAIQTDPAWSAAADDLDAQTTWIVRNFQRLVSGIKTWDDTAMLGAMNLLKGQKTLHPQQENFLQFFESLVNKVVRRLLWGSPLQTTWPPPNSARLWWAQSSDLAQEVGRHKSDLQKTFLGSVPAALNSLNLWLFELEKRLNSMFFGAPRQAAMLEASALCAGLAGIHFAKARHSMAVLFCHRSADLLFTSMCAGAGLIDFTKAYGEGELRVPIGTKYELSLMTCYEAMVQASLIVPNSQQKNSLSNLNATRNRLLLTHGMGSASGTDVQSALQNVVPILKNYGGGSWTTAYNFHRSPPSVAIRDLFELSDGLTQTLQPL